MTITGLIRKARSWLLTTFRKIVAYLTSRSFILSSLALALIWMIVVSAPAQPSAREPQTSQIQFDYSNNSFRVHPRDSNPDQSKLPLTVEEANLLQQQRIAYFALWSVVLVPLSLLFAAISILNQQHNTESTLEAMIRADRPWLDFDFELANEWKPTPSEHGPAILCDFNLSYKNHGKQPAVRVRVDFACLIGPDQIADIVSRYNFRSQHINYGGPNVVMPESHGSTFGELSLPDPNQTDGKLVYIVVSCYYFDPRSLDTERKTAKAFHLRAGDHDILELGSMIELQQAT